MPRKVTSSMIEPPDLKPKSKDRSGASKARKSATAQLRSPKFKSPKTGVKTDWREEMLARMRALILEADPKMIEERKLRKPSNAMAGIPVWSHDGIICTGETYKDKVKLTFARGASLEDPAGLFNSSFEGNTRRAIDFHEGDKIDEKALKALIRAAVALNTSGPASARPVRSQARPTKRLRSA